MGCVGCVVAMWWVCGGCVGSNRMMGVDGDANEEWLVNMGSFGTKVGWCLSGGRSEGNSQRGVFDGEWSCRWWIWCEFGECED